MKKLIVFITAIIFALHVQAQSKNILDKDENLEQPENAPLKTHMLTQKGKTAWSRIS